MSLLSLQHVSVRSGPREVLCDVSLEIGPGELVALSGARRTGKSTLLQVAAGVIAPDAGSALFDGRDPDGERGRRDGLALAYDRLAPAMGPTVLDQVAAPRLPHVSPHAAEREAFAALRRVGAVELSGEPCGASLSFAEHARVVLARALVTGPRLLLADEPALGLAGAERDGLFALLRSLGRDGIAVLLSTVSVSGLGGWRHATIEAGIVRDPSAAGARQPGAVVPLRRGDRGR
jgi:ABC-type Mn2+/Zn2+ transport system ATPase subunit